MFMRGVIAYPCPKLQGNIDKEPSASDGPILLTWININPNKDK